MCVRAHHLLRPPPPPYMKILDPPLYSNRHVEANRANAHEDNWGRALRWKVHAPFRFPLQGVMTEDDMSYGSDYPSWIFYEYEMGVKLAVTVGTDWFTCVDNSAILFMQMFMWTGLLFLQNVTLYSSWTFDRVLRFARVPALKTMLDTCAGFKFYVNFVFVPTVCMLEIVDFAGHKIWLLVHYTRYTPCLFSSSFLCLFLNFLCAWGFIISLFLDYFFLHSAALLNLKT